ncbi:MAG: hypothetical protein Kow0069_37200 [Promethearchaeota archaeon]
MAFGIYEIQIFVMYPILIVAFLFVGYRVYKRNPGQRINAYFALFFAIIGGSLIPNVIYLVKVGGEFIVPDATYLVLNNSINLAVNWAWILLLNFVMIVKLSEAEFDTKKQVLFIVVYSVVEAVLFLLGYYGGIKPKYYVGDTALPLGQTATGDDVVRKPFWELTYGGYGIVTITLMAAIVVLQSVLIFRKFQDPAVKRRFSLFIVGLCVLYYLGLGNYLANTELLGESFRTVHSYLTLLIIPDAWLMYAGVGKEID